MMQGEKIVHAFVFFRLDYCNAFLSECCTSCINTLYLVQNAADSCKSPYKKPKI